jgi:hypothetical protein
MSRAQRRARNTYPWPHGWLIHQRYLRAKFRRQRAMAPIAEGLKP